MAFQAFTTARPAVEWLQLLWVAFNLSIANCQLTTRSEIQSLLRHCSHLCFPQTVVTFWPVKAVQHPHRVALSPQLRPPSGAQVKTPRCRWCWASPQSSPATWRARPRPASPGWRTTSPSCPALSWPTPAAARPCGWAQLRGAAPASTPARPRMRPGRLSNITPWVFWVRQGCVKHCWLVCWLWKSLRALFFSAGCSSTADWRQLLDVWCPGGEATHQREFNSLLPHQGFPWAQGSVV